MKEYFFFTLGLPVSTGSSGAAVGVDFNKLLQNLGGAEGFK